MQSHGFSTAAGVPAHAQSLNTPNFTFAQGYSPGVFTRAHLDTSFSRTRRQKGPSFAVARLLDCDSRPNPRTQPQHTCLHVCARLQQPWRTHTASSRQRGASLRKMRPLTFNNKARPPLSGPTTEWHTACLHVCVSLCHFYHPGPWATKRGQQQQKKASVILDLFARASCPSDIILLQLR